MSELVSVIALWFIRSRSGAIKPLIYLVQGQACLVADYLHLSLRENADLIALTYDEPLSGALYFPHSTWAEGRNELLKEARSRGDYEYYIFCDDDIEFTRGGWDEFEEDLLHYRPAIGVPVVPKTTRMKLPGFRCHAFLVNDEQMMAFHRDVITDNLVLPYQTQFDEVHWWASCEIQQILIQNFYRDSAVQFNRTEIINTCDLRYEDSEDKRKRYKVFVDKWLDEQFSGKYLRCYWSLSGNLLKMLLRTWRFRMRIRGKGIVRKWRAADVELQVKPDSELYNQYRY